MEEFLEMYNFISFTEEHYAFLEEMLYNIENEVHVLSPCSYDDCIVCPFKNSNNIYGKYCGDSGNIMPRFTMYNMNDIKTVIEDIKDSYESICMGFWRLDN